MPQAHEFVSTILAAVRDTSGASLASVFVPGTGGEPILVHSGPEAAVPELHDMACACAFAATQAHRDHELGPGDAVGIVTSVRPDGILLPIPIVTGRWLTPGGGGSDPMLRGVSPRRRAADGAVALAGWVALRFSDGPGSEAGPAAVEPPGLALGQSALALAARLASLYPLLYESLGDPLTGLPGRSVLRTILRRELALPRAERGPISLVFFGPDHFEEVNARHGRTLGDEVLRELVGRARATLRAGDLLCRHGAATFAVVLGDTGERAAAVVTDKLLTALGRAPYLADRLTLRISAGLASLASEAADPRDAVDFIGRAEAALATARSAGGARACVWHAGTTRAAEPLDRLRHAFSGDQDRDYRNMGLLWDAVSLLAASGAAEDFSLRLVSQLRQTLAASMVALFEPREGRLELTCGLSRPQGSAADETIAVSRLTAADQRMVEAAVETAAPIWRADSEDVPQRGVGCAVPLSVDGGLVGVLLLRGSPDVLKMDETDLPFVAGLSAPLGLALDRARAAERKRQQDELERRRLVDELKGLRTALRQTRLVYVSRQMDDLVVTAGRVADTDATVLITGESGTGKEMLAQTIHQMSSRRNRPLVIVDCGAIPSSLIESELFGHERGAFTGALTRSVGRLGQADGGTVLLDEIGELPLDVQSKLLRFVQEKQFTSVGSTAVRRVDVRVLAATNRDLVEEVARGRFRGDLYHRLDVFALAIPPLRQRPEDILQLARHFLEAYAAKYQKPVRSLGAAVEEALLAHSWPGNIRELQNRVMRAVIMSDGETLGLDALALPSGRTASALIPAGVVEDSGAIALAHAPARKPSGRQATGPADAESAWADLREAIGDAVASFSASPRVVHPPLGRWLGNDLVLAAFAESGGVARRGAALLGVPETTFVRRLRRAQREALMTHRPAEWEPVTRAAERLLQSPLPAGQDVLGTAEGYLLEDIDQHADGNAHAGASLLGTSLPTFRRRLTALSAAS